MANLLNEEERLAFVALIDYLIPEAEGMPSASTVGVQDSIGERLLSLRRDLVLDFKRACNEIKGKRGEVAADWLHEHDPTAFAAASLIALAGYYMSPVVRKLIGYPGQENRPASIDRDPDFIATGLLNRVIARGPIYRVVKKEFTHAE